MPVADTCSRHGRVILPGQHEGITMITLYAKQVPSNSHPDWQNMTADERRELAATKRDTIIANNPEFQNVRVQWPWYKRGRPVSRKTITLNCYRFQLKWARN